MNTRSSHAVTRKAPSIVPLPRRLASDFTLRVQPHAPLRAEAMVGAPIRDNNDPRVSRAHPRVWLAQDTSGDYPWVYLSILAKHLSRDPICYARQ
ncbi:protein of unknown function [Pararobbsia alpina]